MLTWAEGDFTEGHQQGHGTLRWPAGHRLVGTWQADSCHGPAHLHVASGEHMECFFARNVLLPGGTMVLADGTRRDDVDYAALCLQAFRPGEPFDANWVELLLQGVFSRTFVLFVNR